MHTSLKLVAAAILVSYASVGKAETWNITGGGSWIVPTNWNPQSVPNGPSATATINSAGIRTITLDAPITLGEYIYNINGTNTTTLNDGTGTNGGDYNGDGIVDAGDYATWRKGGDLLNDPTFGNDPGDYDLWRAHYGTNGNVGLTFDAPGAGPAKITTIAAGSTGRTRINASMHLFDDLLITVDGPAATSFDGNVRLFGSMDGPGGLTRVGGSATQSLFNMEGSPKTYTGPTVLAAGRTRMTPGASPGNSSSFTISNDAQFEPFGDGTYNLGAGTLFLNGNGTGAGASGIIRPSRDASHGYFVEIPNPIVLQSDTVIHSQAANGQPTPPPGSGTATGFIKLGGVISGSKHLELTYHVPGDANIGSYYLQGQNTYSGGTDLWGGKLIVGDESGSFPNATLGTGNVTIHAGSSIVGGRLSFLEIDTGVNNAIADAATLSLQGGLTAGVADDGYAFLGSLINETVGGLILGGTAQTIAGTYGSTTSPATFQNDEYFSGDGMINLVFLGSGSSLGSSSAIPEPSTLALAGMMAALALLGRRHQW